VLHNPANGAEAYIFHGERYILINLQLSLLNPVVVELAKRGKLPSEGAETGTNGGDTTSEARVTL